MLKKHRLHKSELLNWKVAVFLRCTFIKTKQDIAKQQKRAPYDKAQCGDMHLISTVLQVLLQSPVKGEWFHRKKLI